MRGRVWRSASSIALSMAALACSKPFTAGPGGDAGDGGASASEGGAASSFGGTVASGGAPAAGAGGAEDAGAGGDAEPGTGGGTSNPAGYADAILAAKPLAYWRMGIESGLVVPDETGHENALLLQGSGHQLSVAGALHTGDDGAIAFDGETNFAMAESPRVFDFNAGAAFSLECWARRENGGSSYFQHLLSNTVGIPGDRTGFMLYTLPAPGSGDAARSAFEYDAPGDETGLWGDLPEASQWAYYVAVYDGSAVTLYVDATLADSHPTKALLAARMGPFTVARASDGGAFFKGALDEIAIYGRALSASEIVRHFELASAR